MFEYTFLLSPQILPLSKLWKGGDFMELEALEDKLRDLRESEVPYPAGYDLGINPDKGLAQAVHIEGRVPSTDEDPFPKVVGRTRFDTTLR